MKEFMKYHIKLNTIRNQKQYIQYKLYLNKKLAIRQVITWLSQSNEKIYDLNNCTDHSKLPDYNMKDTLLYIHNPSI